MTVSSRCVRTLSLRRRQMMNLPRNLLRHRRRPRRAAAALDVDFHPVELPALGRPDAVHGGGALNAARMRFIEEQHRLFAAGYLFDLGPQQPAILYDRLVAL